MDHRAYKSRALQSRRISRGKASQQHSAPRYVCFTSIALAQQEAGSQVEKRVESAYCIKVDTPLIIFKVLLAGAVDFAGPQARVHTKDLVCQEKAIRRSPS